MPVALDPLAVLGMDGVEPAVAEELLHGLPGDPAPLGRVLEHLAVGRRHPDDLGAALDERAVPLLAPPQGLLRIRSRAARDDDETRAVKLAVRTVHAEPVEGPLSRRALPGPGGAGLERLGGRAALGEHLGQRGLGSRGVHRGKHLGDGTAAEIAQLAAVHARERRVGPDEAQIGVEERHPGRRVAQHGVGQPGFKLAQSGLPLLRHGGVRAQPSTSPTMQAPATGGSFLLPRCQKTPPTWRLAAARRRRGMAPPPQRSLRIRVPQSRDRCCQLAAGKPSPHRREPPGSPSEGARKGRHGRDSRHHTAQWRQHG